MKICIIMDSAGEFNLMKKKVADAMRLGGDNCLLHMITTSVGSNLVRFEDRFGFLRFGRVQGSVFGDILKVREV